MCSRTGYDSSVKESTKIPSSSSALSILFAYSPIIQMRDALASGSSSSSRLAHNVGMTPSYVEGYFRKISYPRKYLTLSLRKVRKTNLHDNNCLLDNVADAGCNEIQKDINATFRCSINLYGRLSNRLDAFANKVYIHFGSISARSELILDV